MDGLIKTKQKKGACWHFCPWRKSHQISAFLAHFLKLANGSPLHLTASQALAPVLSLGAGLCMGQDQSLGFLQLSGSPGYTPHVFQSRIMALIFQCEFSQVGIPARGQLEVPLLGTSSAFITLLLWGHCSWCVDSDSTISLTLLPLPRWPCLYTLSCRKSVLLVFRLF